MNQVRTWGTRHRLVVLPRGVSWLAWAIEEVSSISTSEVEKKASGRFGRNDRGGSVEKQFEGRTRLSRLWTWGEAHPCRNRKGRAPGVGRLRSK